MQGAINYRRDIDGLRAVAVLPVVLCHAGVPGFAGGFIGVDVFFVISGYLITTIITQDIAQQRFSLLTFYARRARRILPALAAVLIACLAVGWLVMMPGELTRLGRSTIAAALFASNFHFARGFDYFAPAAEYQPLLHTWSLAVEEQFYIVFPLAIMAMAALRWSRHLPGVIAAVSALSLAAAAALLSTAPDLVFYLSIFRAWELGAGALLAVTVWRKPASPALREAVGVAGLAAILVPVYFYTSETPFPALAALPPVLGAAALVWIGRDGPTSLATRLLANPALVGIGLISYSLYLWHWPVLSYLRLLERATNLAPAMMAAALAGSLVLGWLSWRFIEQPFRRPVRQPTGQRRTLAVAVAVMGIIGWAGETLHDRRGVPSRLPQETVRIAEAAKDSHRNGKTCLGRAPPQDLCPLGLPAAPGRPVDFVLLGDSHAEMLRAGLDDAARDAGQHGYYIGKVGCVPMRDIERAPMKVDCGAFNAATWSWLEQWRDVGTVIVSVRWTVFVEGTGIGPDYGTSFGFRWTGPEARRPAADTNPALIEAALAAMVDTLVASGRQVVLVGPIPEPGYHVPNDTARRVLMGLAPRPEVPRAEFEARTRRTEAILQRVAARSARARYLPMSDLFCSDRSCRARDAAGMPLYSDDDHVTRTAARTLLRPRFDSIWAPPAP